MLENFVVSPSLGGQDTGPMLAQTDPMALPGSLVGTRDTPQIGERLTRPNLVITSGVTPAPSREDRINCSPLIEQNAILS
jgi:hypothetical protein